MGVIIPAGPMDREQLEQLIVEVARTHDALLALLGRFERAWPERRFPGGWGTEFYYRRKSVAAALLLAFIARAVSSPTDVTLQADAAALGRELEEMAAQAMHAAGSFDASEG